MEKRMGLLGLLLLFLCGCGAVPAIAAVVGTPFRCSLSFETPGNSNLVFGREDGAHGWSDACLEEGAKDAALPPPFPLQTAAGQKAVSRYAYFVPAYIPPVDEKGERCSPGVFLQAGRLYRDMRPADHPAATWTLEVGRGSFPVYWPGVKLSAGESLVWREEGSGMEKDMRVSGSATVKEGRRYHLVYRADGTVPQMPALQEIQCPAFLGKDGWVRGTGLQARFPYGLGEPKTARGSLPFLQRIRWKWQEGRQPLACDVEECRLVQTAPDEYQAVTAGGIARMRLVPSTGEFQYFQETADGGYDDVFLRVLQVSAAEAEAEEAEQPFYALTVRFVPLSSAIYLQDLVQNAPGAVPKDASYLEKTAEKQVTLQLRPQGTGMESNCPLHMEFDLLSHEALGGIRLQFPSSGRDCADFSGQLAISLWDMNTGEDCVFLTEQEPDGLLLWGISQEEIETALVLQVDWLPGYHQRDGDISVTLLQAEGGVLSSWRLPMAVERLFSLEANGTEGISGQDGQLFYRFCNNYARYQKASEALRERMLEDFAAGTGLPAPEDVWLDLEEMMELLASLNGNDELEGQDGQLVYRFCNNRRRYAGGSAALQQVILGQFGQGVSVDAEEIWRTLEDVAVSTERLGLPE